MEECIEIVEEDIEIVEGDIEIVEEDIEIVEEDIEIVEEDIELVVFVVEKDFEIEIEVYTEIVGEDIAFAAEGCYMYSVAD